MPAFSAVNGSPPHASVWMLRDVLRDRLGFKGLIVSDWTAIMELVKHGVAATSGEAAQLAMHAGVDVDMSDGLYVDSLPARARDNPRLRSEINAADAPSAASEVRARSVLGSVPWCERGEGGASHAHCRESRSRAGGRARVDRAAQERASDAAPVTRDQAARGDRRARRKREERDGIVDDRRPGERDGVGARWARACESLHASPLFRGRQPRGCRHERDSRGRSARARRRRDRARARRKLRSHG